MADPIQEEIDKEVATHKILIYGKEIGRASCRERVCLAV